MSDTWSVRYVPVHGEPEDTGGTGMPSADFAQQVYDRLVDKAREHGGLVELVKNGEVVVSFEAPEVKR